MTRTTRPAAYIRVAPDSLTTALVAQRSAVYQAARGRGWAEPTVYIHVDGADGHDDCSDCAEPVLANCTRRGVAVECITAPATVTRGTYGSRSHPQP
jgi:hypothetical protein